MIRWFDKRCDPNLSPSCLLVFVFIAIHLAYTADLQFSNCLENNCLNGGICMEDESTFRCKCPTNHTGPRCETRDPCLNNPCRPHAQCVSNNLGQYHCVCPPGWTGSHCNEDVDECSIDERPPCEHDGTCVNTPGSYACFCRTGFTGTRCEDLMLHCSTDPCFNGGTCIDIFGGYQCRCLLGFEGENCEIETNECATSPCLNGGQCEDLVGHYQCHCLPDWTGPHCETQVITCADTPCANGGVCENRRPSAELHSTRGYVCHCRKGFTGINCEVSNTGCYNKTCLNGGLCMEHGTGWICSCPSGFEGSICELPALTNASLSLAYTTVTSLTTFEPNIAVAKASLLQFTNRCLDGSHCEFHLHPCSKNPCLHGGTCELVPNSTSAYLCQCVSGFEGQNCEWNTFDCFQSYCGVYGYCADQIEGHRCECLFGANGSLCSEAMEKHNITPSPSALLPKLTAQPTRSACPTQYCNNSAICATLYSSSVELYCDCETALGFFAGMRCETDVDECATDLSAGRCQNGAECVNIHGSYFCRCLPGFEGRHCEHRIDPCTYPVNPVCLNGGQCISRNTSFQCSCPPGFSGAVCETVIDYCANEPCQDGHICITHLNSFSCIRLHNNTETHCSLAFLQQTPTTVGSGECENGGLWVPSISGGFCKCPFGFVGSHCESSLNLCMLSTREHVADSRSLLTDIERAVLDCLLLDDSDLEAYNLLSRALLASLAAHGNSTEIHQFGDVAFTNLGVCDPVGAMQCIPRPGDFNCSCRMGYEGKLCKDISDACVQADSRFNQTYCLNGGTCDNQVGISAGDTVHLTQIAVCHCAPGFGGPRCELYAEQCVQNPCKNGGVCHPNGLWATNITLVPHKAPYVCLCLSGWAGVHCEVDTRVACATSADCGYAGQCLSANGIPKCNCVPRHCGTRCELRDEQCTGVATVEDPNTWNGTQSELEKCALSDCQRKRNNGQCDPECNYLACAFDGLECIFALPMPLKPRVVDNVELLDSNLHTPVEIRPAPAKPWSACAPITRFGTACHLKFDDGRCDPECNEESCLFDGWDCEAAVNKSSRFSGDSPTMVHCTQEPNNENCSSEMHLSSWSTRANDRNETNREEDHSQTVALIGSLVLLLDVPPGELFSDFPNGTRPSVLIELVQGLSELLHLGVQLIKASDTQQPMAYPVWLTVIRNPLNPVSTNVAWKNVRLSDEKSTSAPGNRSQRYRRTTHMESSGPQDEVVVGSEVHLHLDASSCYARGGSCFRHVDTAAQFVAAAMHRRNYAFLRPVLSVQSANAAALVNPRDKPFSRSKLHWFRPSSWLLLVLLTFFGLVIMGLLIGVLFTVNQFRQQQHQHLGEHQHGCTSAGHRRSLALYLQFIERRKNAKKVQRAKIWYPQTVLSHRGVGLSKYAADRAYYKHTGCAGQAPTGKLSDADSETERRHLRHYLTNDPMPYDEASMRNNNMQAFHSPKNITSSSFVPSKSVASPLPQKESRNTQSHMEVFRSPTALQRTCSNSQLAPCAPDPNDVVHSEAQGRLLASQALSLFESHDSSVSTTSTRLSGTTSDMGTASDSISSDLDVWYFYRIVKLLSDGDGLGDDSNVSPDPYTNADLTKSDSVKQLLFHITQLDPQLHPTQANSLGVVVQTTTQVKPPSLCRILDMKLPETGESLLHLASRWNRSAAVLALLDVGADPTNVDKSGRTALLSAVCSGAMESVHAILSHPVAGSNPMCFVPSLLTDSTTPLMQAVKLNDVESFKLILHAMNVLVCSLARNNVINTAYCPGTEENLQSTSCGSNAPKYANKSVVFVASNPVHEDGSMSVLDLNNSDNLGRTALHWAAATDQVECIRCLLDAGAAFDVQTACDETPLALAAREGCLSACRLLLAAGANPDLADYLDRNPKTLAELNGHTEVVKLLQVFQNISPPRQSSVLARKDAQVSWIPGDSTSPLAEWSFFVGSFPTTSKSVTAPSCDRNSFGPSYKTTGEFFFSDVAHDKSIAPNWNTFHSITDSRLSSFRNDTQSHNCFSKGAKANEYVKQEEECRETNIIVRPSEQVYTGGPIRLDQRGVRSNETESHIRTNVFMRPFSDLLFSETNHIDTTRRDEKVPESAESHLMGSDSESPNRWSSSPSDSPPKHSRSLVKSPFMNITHHKRVPLHNTVRPLDLRPFTTPDPTHALHVAFQ